MKIYPAHIPVDRNISIESGDEIQVSCVYDSSERDSKTSLGLSTYDEMCIHSFQTIHSTTDIAYAPFGTFRCEGNITMGTMEEHENGFDIGTGIHREAFKTDIWWSNLGNSVDKKVDVSNEKVILRYYADDSCTLSNGIATYDSKKYVGLSVIYPQHLLDERTEAIVQISEGKNNTYMSHWPPVQHVIHLEQFFHQKDIHHGVLHIVHYEMNLKLSTEQQQHLCAQHGSH